MYNILKAHIQYPHPCLEMTGGGHTRVKKRGELGEVRVMWRYSLSFFVLPQGDTEVRLPESPKRDTEVKYLLKRLGSGCTGCVCMCVQVEEVISYFYTTNMCLYHAVKIPAYCYIAAYAFFM